MLTKTILYKGESVEAEVVDFEEVSQPWSEIRLADGSRIRIKTVVYEVLKVPGERYDNGEPVYMVKSERIIVQAVPQTEKRVIAPPSLAVN